jgi:hypothetical protein
MDMLSLFNRQVLECQDEAYTFAWYFSGNESEAESITRTAVKDSFFIFSRHGQTCRLVILKMVARLCRKETRGKDILQASPGPRGLKFLPEEERQALILVDILRLSYADTAAVLGQPVKNVSRLLAQARRKMMDYKG